MHVRASSTDALSVGSHHFAPSSSWICFSNTAASSARKPPWTYFTVPLRSTMYDEGMRGGEYLLVTEWFASCTIGNRPVRAR